MNAATYNAIKHKLGPPVSSAPAYSLLQAQYEDVSLDTLISIYSQSCQDHVKKMSDTCRTNMSDYCEWYAQGVDILEISLLSCYPACLLLRRILEHMYRLNKKASGAIMRSPDQLPQLLDGVAPEQQQRMQQDVVRCVVYDHTASPFGDFARNSIGVEYELYLAEQLAEVGVPFWTESDLRGRGLHKTPDACLQVPMMVGGQVVCWIDSKATFADLRIHERQMEEQYRGYVRRYGPGMVVYWFGYSEDVLRASELTPEVLVVDGFPPRGSIELLQVLGGDEAGGGGACEGAEGAAAGAGVLPGGQVVGGSGA